MRKLIILGIAATAMLAFSATSWAGGDVVHWWVGDAESKALKVIVDQFESSGGKWVDTPHNDSEAAHASVKSRVIGGNPPGAVLMVVGASTGGAGLSRKAAGCRCNACGCPVGPRLREALCGAVPARCGEGTSVP